MHLDLSPDELLTTTRAVRKRLDFERPVEREVVEECIAIALQAPTGSNRQTWHWVVVEDADKKRAVAEEYAIGFQLALRSRGLGSALTTLHLLREREVADLLGIPYDDVTQAALMPVAYTKSTDFKPAPRQPLADVVHWGAW